MNGTLIFIAVIVVILIIVLKKANNESQPVNNQPSRTRLTAAQEYYTSWKTIGLTPRQGYKKLNMVGMNYRGIDASDLGKFEGYALAQTNNIHDPYAIAIHREDGVHVGFLERGHAALHRYITEQGSMVHCYGYIACGGLDGAGQPTSFYAEVCVETDKKNVANRNKAYNTDDKFYNYETGNLKSMLDESQA